MKILVLYYSMYGHIDAMARAVAEGICEVDGAKAVLRRAAETLSGEVLKKMGALPPPDDVEVATLDDLEAVDAVIFGTPTRFGNMCAQMKQFLDSTGGLWMKGALIGKAAGVFTSSNTQHGGQESTILSFHITLLHHGMVIVGLPYKFEGQMRTDEITGGSPYGASTIAGGDSSRQPSENELSLARSQGRHITEIAGKLIK